MARREIDFKFLYPNLIIFLGSNKNEPLFKQLDKSFKEFQYGPLFKKEGTCYKHELGLEVSTCQIMQGAGVPICLADGEGPMPCDAEEQAVERLLNKLCESCYVVKANQLYFTRKNIPTFALDADPLHSHIYKVVFLRTNSRGARFPKPVSGAIDYVETYDELMAYIETHAKSDTKADLFILNVLKPDRARIRHVCQKNGMSIQFLVNCSDMGIYAYHNMSTLMILQSLLKDGGKNVKYKLIGPRDKYGDNEDKVDEKVAAGVVQTEHSTEDQEEIVINQWIADHLVIMETVTHRNDLESKYKIILQSVWDCPDTQQFIVEKKRTSTGKILAEAMIDRYVVGRTRGFKARDVKIEASEDAMKNLMKCCYYIQAKESYFGSIQDVPHFLRQPIPVPVTKIYRIADKSKGPPNKILQQFKSSWQEDLYFLKDFTEEEKRYIEQWLGRKSYLCVYKKRKPREVLMELLSTPSRENEKYKLITPPSKIHEQVEGRATHQNWNNQGTSHNAQSNLRPINRAEEPYNPPSVSDTRANTLDYQSSYVDHRSASQSFEKFQPTNRDQKSYNTPSVSDTKANTSDCQSSYVDHGSASQSFEQGAQSKAPGQETKETPNWVMKFIQSAPLKPKKPPPFKMSRPIEPPRHRDDVYNRYKFIAPKTLPPPSVTTSNVNVRGAVQRPVQNVNRDNVTPSKDLEHGSTLSERLQQMLEEEKNWSNKQDVTKQIPPNASNKRPFDQGPDVKEECEPLEKIFKPTTNTYSSYYNSSVESSKGKGEPSNIFSKSQTSELSMQKPKTWGSNVGDSGFEDWSRTDRPFTNNPSLEEEEDSKHNMYTMSDAELNSLRRGNLYDQGSSVNVKIESGKDPSTQQNNSLWDQGTKQQLDQRPNTSTGGQRNINNLFDFTGPQSNAYQGDSRPIFPPRPPAPWRKNKQFKGHSFSKLEKYGKKKGPY